MFDDTLKQALATELQQSPFFNVLPDRKLNETLKLMGRPTDQRIDENTAVDLCERARSKAVLAGSIARMGSQYVIGLHAINCQTGDSLAREEVQATKKEDVLNALDKAAKKIRVRVGESFSTIQKYDTPIAEATTPSLEALKAFSLALKTQHQKGDVAAIPFLKRAIDLDPNFAQAYSALGITYNNLGETGLAIENLKKAFALRDRVSEPEKLLISAVYYNYVTGELEKANQTYELWAQAYPRHSGARLNLGVNFKILGQYERAISETVEALRLNPEVSSTYVNLILDYAYLNRLNDAKATFQQATAHKLQDPLLNAALYAVAFLQLDSPEMQRLLSWAAGKPGVEDILLSGQADTEAFFGHLGKSREFSRRAVDSAKHAEQKETAAEWQLNAALREAEFGNAVAAREGTAAALSLASTRDVKILGALCLARAGDSSRARTLATDLARQNPLDTLINGYWLPTVRATIEINNNNFAKAVDLLQTASAYELGYAMPAPEYGGFLYPAYVRGQAYLLLHKGSEAAAEFQKFLDYRGVVVNCLLSSLAHLGLARAYVLQSDDAKASAAYQDFLALWKDADPDIPVLKQAKAEYAKLQ